jgi:hypothetical protein
LIYECKTNLALDLRELKRIRTTFKHQTTHEMKRMKEKEQYFPGSAIGMKDEREESAETYKNSLSQELVEAIERNFMKKPLQVTLERFSHFR